MKCNDCGETLGHRQRSIRDDVCDECWDRRMLLATGKMPVSHDGIVRCLADNAHISDSPILAHDTGLTFRGHRIFIEGDRGEADKFASFCEGTLPFVKRT